MLKIIVTYIFYFLIYIYLHILFIFCINTFCFSLKIKYYSNINLSYNTILKYKNNIDLYEKTLYESFDIKNIFIKNKNPILQINDTLFFDYNIGIPKKLYINEKKIILDQIPLINSLIPIYEMNEFMIKLIHKQYLHYYMMCNEFPIITIINKKLISIQTSNAYFLLFPWEIISKTDYEKIIKQKITDLRLHYKNKE